jgi:thymidylate synthase (FAD)
MLDPMFKVAVLAATRYPQQLIYQALHQDYSENCVCDTGPPPEDVCGKVAVKRLLNGKRNHWGPFEHPQISFNVCNFPHDVMQQARTHRIGCSFDVQSGRYTGQRIIDVARGDRTVEEVFYFRPVGNYTDREGKKYTAHAHQRAEQLKHAMRFSHHYAQLIADGWAEEHARAMCPYAIRQHFVVSFTMRALVHFLCVRGKLDAQLEIQALGDLMLPHFKAWAPEIGNWYEENLHTKAILAP